MIEDFLSKSTIKVPRGCRVTIFREPRIESGFPDLVVVVWHTATTERWPAERSELSNDDIRLMHYLVSAGPASQVQIELVLGRNVGNNLARLEIAEMVRKSGTRWVPRALSRIFAARHIIAIEAKISEWQDALDQAHLNTWFASSSCVMMPRIPKGSGLLSKADALGLGVWDSVDQTFDVRQFPSRQLPLSYASWLFNEWAWRAAIKQHQTKLESQIADTTRLGESTIP